MANEENRGDAYTVLTPANCAIGPSALVINNIGTLPLEWKRPLEIPRQYLDQAVTRAEELARVHERLHAETYSSPHRKGVTKALWGPPGVGKSTLAALYAESYQEQYSGGVLWLSMGPEARGPESVNPSLRRVAAYAYRADAQALSLLASVVFSPDLVRSLLEGHGPLLIVADDVWDAAALAHLREALPVQGHLLITTREARVARVFGRTVELDVLTHEDALEYTRRPLSTGPDGQPRRLTPEQRQELIKAVGRHPLALAVAFGDLSVRGEDRWSGCIARIGQMVGEGQGFGDLPLLDEAERESRVAEALQHSYAAMPSKVQRRFRALGCMAQEASFDTAAAAAIWKDDEQQAQEYLDVLAARALLNRQPAGRWQQHSILRAYALSRQSPQEKEDTSLAHAFHYLSVLHHYHDAKPRDDDRLEQEFPQVAHAYSLASKNNLVWGSLLVHLCADFLRNRGLLTLLRAWLQGAQRLSSAHEYGLGKASTLKSMGDLEFRVGNVDAARKHYEAALSLFEAVPSQLGRANTLRSLGDVERRLGRLEQARQRYDEALLLYEAEKNNLGLANTFRSLGDLEKRLGDIGAARRHYLTALSLCEADQDRLGKANTLRSLGNLEARLGNLEEARKCFDAALPLFEAEQSKRGKADILDSLGRLEFHLGHSDKAREHYVTALAICEDEQDWHGRAYTLRNLGDLECRLGNLEEARKHFVMALPIFEAEQDGLGRANTIWGLGNLGSALGNVDEARSHYEAALHIYKVEQDGLGTANTLWSMGNLERQLGHVGEARKHYDAALSLYEAEQNAFGKADTLKSLGELDNMK